MSNIPPNPSPEPRKAPIAGGVFILPMLILGLVIGFWTHQISLGMIGGLIGGFAVAGAVWLYDRRR